MAAPELAAGHVIDGQTTVSGVMARGTRVTAHEGVSAPGRQVVIKLYDPALGAASLVALQAAADVTRDLPRGYALEVLEVGVEGTTGGAFVVTERSARPSLAHLVQLCPLSPDEVVALVRSLARALGGAHERGLPHLGLKPTNVFVGAPPACEVQLADFGATVARATKVSADIDPEGAPWQSPEQAFGGLPPGVSSDIFSTALVVFFALTGRSYWRAFSAGGDPSAWAREIWAVRAPASVRAAELGASLPAAWDIPFARALDVDPARRPRSIAELAESFARAARGEPALDPPALSLPRFEVAPLASTSSQAAAPTPPQGLSAATGPHPAPSPRSRAPWIAGGLALAALVGLALFLAARLTRSPPSPTPTAAVAAPPPPASAPPPAPAISTSAAPTPMPTPATALASTTPAPTPAVSDPQMATLLVTCNPPCDSIWVDGHPAPDAATGKPLPPGVHMIGANLARHTSKVQPVLLKRGEVTRVDVDFDR